VPEDYVGTLFTPGGMALTDRGFGSANEVWSFQTASAEGEVEVFDDGAGGELVDPFDIAVRADGFVVIADSTNGLQTPDRQRERWRARCCRSRRRRR
jgi:2-polyprenyl-6-methoxyphenol hydroxylase-like FAD-dependent oxidoreductase